MMHMITENTINILLTFYNTCLAFCECWWLGISTVITFYVYLKRSVKPDKTTWHKLNSLFSCMHNVKCLKTHLLVFTEQIHREERTHKRNTQRSIFYHHLTVKFALVASWEHSHNCWVPPLIVSIVLNVSNNPKTWSP